MKASRILNLQKIDEAKAALEDALKQDPKSPNAWYNLGMLAKNTGDAQAAIDAFKHVIEIDANDADTWYFLGRRTCRPSSFRRPLMRSARVATQPAARLGGVWIVACVPAIG
jgi:tetratricopeptide (TPR) repeat protein